MQLMAPKLPHFLFMLLLSSSRRAAAFAAAVAALTLPLAAPTGRASTLYWDGTGTTWNLAANWSTSSSAATPDPASFPLAGDDVVFNISTVNTAQLLGLGADEGANSLTFSSTGAVSIYGTGITTTGTIHNLTLGGGGMTLNSGAGAVTIGLSGNQVGVILGASQAWANNSASILTVSNSITGSATTNTPTTLTLGGTGVGNTVLGLTLKDGASGSPVSLIVNQTGTGTVMAQNGAVSTFTGGTTVKAGLLSTRDTFLMNAGQGTVVLGDTSANTANVQLNLITGNTTGGTGVGLTTAAGTTGTITLNLGVGSSPLSHTISGAVTLNNSGNLLVTRTGTSTTNLASLILTNTVSGVGGLTFTGGATADSFVLGGNNTFGGGVTLNQGTLSINSATALGTGTLTVAGGRIDNTSGSAVAVSNNNAITLNAGLTFVGSNNLDLGTGAVLTGAGGTRTFTVTANTLTVGGVIANGTANTSLTVSGAGTLVANGANTFLGATNVGTGSTLSVAVLADGGVASGVGASTNVAGNLKISDTATLRYTGAGGSTNRLFTLGSAAAANTGTIDASGTGAISFTSTASPSYNNTNVNRTLILTGTNTGANTFAANVADNGTGVVALTKNGAGTWTVTGASTYTGATTVNGGVLRIDNNGTTTPRISSTAGGIVLNAGTLALASSSGASTDRINNATPVSLSGGMLNLGGFSEGAAGTTGVGALTLTATSTLDFGTAGTNNVIQFASVGAHTINGGVVLQIINWEGAGNTTTGGTNDRLLFAGTDPTAFTNTYSQSDVSFNGNAGYGITGNLGGYYEVFAAPVPEPSTVWAGAVISALLGLRTLRLRSKRRAA